MSPEEPQPDERPILEAPRDGVPPVVADAAGMDRLRDSLGAGTGPLAIDTERAQSFRYTAKAYLIQLRRTGSGTHLLDPVAFEPGDGPADLSALTDHLADEEWIIHAATQDLPCLVEVGMVPTVLFDTELAARLLGFPRVSLGTLIEEAFGLVLRKEHSAADWSRRPLPADWLTYAALDVELLVELRDWERELLEEAGKTEWAAQEFAHLVAHATDAAPARSDPWRRTSGLHTLRTPAALAVVRELWHTRDEIAASIDRAPGRVLPDRAIVELAAQLEPAVRRLGREQLREVPSFRWRTASRYEGRWLAALDRAARLTRDQLPPRYLSSEGPPPPRSWEAKDPEAAARWQRVRPPIEALAQKLELPVENLMPPDALRRLLWEPPADEGVDDFLCRHGVRPWQRELAVPLIEAAL